MDVKQSTTTYNENRNTSTIDNSSSSGNTNISSKPIATSTSASPSSPTTSSSNRISLDQSTDSIDSFGSSPGGFSSQSSSISPDLLEKDQTNVFVKYLPNEYGDYELYTLFSPFGKVMSAKVMVDAKGNSYGYGFVRFSSPAESKKAIDNMDGFQLMHKKLLCRLSNLYSNCNNKYPSNNLFVKPLPATLSDDQLKDLFTPFGEILECKVMIDQNGNSKLAGFVRFSNEADATKALQVMNGTKMKDITTPLVVKYADNEHQKTMRKQRKYSHYITTHPNPYGYNYVDHYLYFQVQPAPYYSYQDPNAPPIPIYPGQPPIYNTYGYTIPQYYAPASPPESQHIIGSPPGAQPTTTTTTTTTSTSQQGIPTSSPIFINQIPSHPQAALLPQHHHHPQTIIYNSPPPPQHFQHHHQLLPQTTLAPSPAQPQTNMVVVPPAPIPSNTLIPSPNNNNSTSQNQSTPPTTSKKQHHQSNKHSKESSSSTNNHAPQSPPYSPTMNPISSVSSSLSSSSSTVTTPSMVSSSSTPKRNTLSPTNLTSSHHQSHQHQQQQQISNSSSSKNTNNNNNNNNNNNSPTSTTPSSGNDTNLFVFHLPGFVDDAYLYKLFSRFGPLLSVRVITDKDTGENKGYGFVKFQNKEDALTSLNEMNGLQIGQKYLKVKFKDKTTPIPPPHTSLPATPPSPKQTTSAKQQQHSSHHHQQNVTTNSPLPTPPSSSKASSSNHHNENRRSKHQHQSQHH